MKRKFKIGDKVEDRDETETTIVGFMPSGDAICQYNEGDISLYVWELEDLELIDYILLEGVIDSPIKFYEDRIEARCQTIDIKQAKRLRTTLNKWLKGK